MTIEDVTSQALAWAAALAMLVPILTPLITRPSWPKRLRFAIAIIVGVIAGLTSWIAAHGLDFSSPSAVVVTVLGVVAASQVAYREIWKGSGIPDAIEARTSPTTPQSVAPGDPTT